MTYIELTEFLVKSVVEKEEDVSIQLADSTEDEILVNVFVSKDDIGRVIGKQGKTANSIRTIVQASFFKDFSRIKIDFQSFE